MIDINKLPRFDAAQMLTTQESIIEYLNLVLEENDLDALTHALGVVARAKGMTQVARSANVDRSTLYKSLKEGATPRLDTINKVGNALGLKLTFTSI